MRLPPVAVMIVSKSVHVDTVTNRSGSSWARHSVTGPWAAESSANVPSRTSSVYS